MSKNKAQEQACLQLKADFLPLTVLKLSKIDIHAITQELTDSIEKAPHYFKNAPVVIDIKDLHGSPAEIDLQSLCATLRNHKIIPVGIRGLHESQQELAINNGLAILAANNNSAKEAVVVKEIKEGKDKKPQPENNPTKTKLITKPVRAGTQIYAQESDLILLAAVNPGGEIIADGNIHVYGPLRGRALAGARGDTNARIFCASLDAELISIAGHYLVKEKIALPKTKKSMIQIYLHQNKLQIEGI